MVLGIVNCSVPYHIGWLADTIMITPVINVAAVPSAQAPLAGHEGQDEGQLATNWRTCSGYNLESIISRKYIISLLNYVTIIVGCTCI